MTIQHAKDMCVSINQWIMLHDTNMGNASPINYTLFDMMLMAKILRDDNAKILRRKAKGTLRKGGFFLNVVPDDLHLAALYVCMNVLGEDPTKKMHSLTGCNGNYIMVARPEVAAQTKDERQLDLVKEIEKVEGKSEELCSK
jgi:hypothetical protein